MTVLSPSTVRECWNAYTAIAILPCVMRTPKYSSSEYLGDPFIKDTNPWALQRYPMRTMSNVTNNV